MADAVYEKHNQGRARRWLNPYILKLSEFPAVIIGTAEKGMTEEEQGYFKSRIVAAPSVVCELGSGSGGFLIEHAARSPETLFIGFELRFKRVFKTAEKAVERGLKNVLVAKLPAQEVLSLFGPGTLRGIHVNFPDPWDKRRWEKHRLLNPDFLKPLVTRLAPGGFLSYKTDHARYFEDTYQQVLRLPELDVKVLSRNLADDPLAVENVPTEFEKLFRSKGIAIHFLKAEKRANYL